MIDWYVEGPSFGNCNCDYNCPCQFELRPSRGHCRGFGMVRIDKGHFGEVMLDGLGLAVLYAWPGPIFEGGGTMQALIDERADESQRRALVTIAHGGETAEAKTHWWVFHAMSSTVHAPIFAAIQLEIDIGRRRARAAVAGLLESTGRPIISRATGREHRVQIACPEGIEFEVAEIGSASTRARGIVTLDLDDSYGQFDMLRLTGEGVVRGRG
jgi:hypothetical protein